MIKYLIVRNLSPIIQGLEDINYATVERKIRLKLKFLSSRIILYLYIIKNLFNTPITCL